MAYTVEHYITADGKDPTQSWLDGLRDMKGRVAVLRRIDRVTLGNFGDHKPVGGGVWELRVDVAQVTVSITPKPATPWYCCCVVVTRAASRQTSSVHLHIGQIGNGETHEIPIP